MPILATLDLLLHLALEYFVRNPSAGLAFPKRESCRRIGTLSFPPVVQKNGKCLHKYSISCYAIQNIIGNMSSSRVSINTLIVISLIKLLLSGHFDFVKVCQISRRVTFVERIVWIFDVFHVDHWL